MGAGEVIYRHRERRPQLLSGQTRPIGTGQEISRSPSDYERGGEQVSVREREQTALCKGCGWSFGLVNLYAGHKSGEWLCVECLDIQNK